MDTVRFGMICYASIQVWWQLYRFNGEAPSYYGIQYIPAEANVFSIIYGLIWLRKGISRKFGIFCLLPVELWSFVLVHCTTPMSVYAALRIISENKRIL